MKRRDLLLRSLQCAAGSAAFTALSGKLQLANAATLQRPKSRMLAGGDYRALVCIYLYGGNDAFNMVVPTGSGYAQYATARADLAIPEGELLPLSPVVPPTGGGSFGTHPGMPELQSLFNSQRAAIVANTGPLLYPITKAEYTNGTVPVPAQLFSHSDQTVLWQTPQAETQNRRGWGGRLADLFYSTNVNQQLSMNISVSGENVFQSGETIVPYFVSTQGAEAIHFVEDVPWLAERRAAFLALRDGTYAHPLQREYVRRMTRAMDNQAMITSALDGAPPLATAFPDTYLGRQLRMVARLLSARSSLQMTRQIFFVAAGGYDTHDAQLGDHADHLAELSGAISAFYNATVELGLDQQVTSFTASEFGRTLSINGDGTDHGWGSHHLVVGGAVNGGRIYGTPPDLTIDGPDDAGWGQIIPTQSVDQYAATLSTWYGLSDSDRDMVFPNLSRFSSPNLGFMA
ncbi:MAG: DUF1501 domain-containing protein [Xanthomonadales bacterium]|nr:DUF1501 domain-containing protein [Xanthomonadales bacterium]